MAKEFNTFVPTYPSVHKNGSCFDLPLFPGYVFCRMDCSNPLPVVSTPGVFRVVSNGSDLDSIPDEEIEGIKRLLSAGLTARPSKYYAPGQSVYFREGPFKGIRGVVIDVSSERWLILSVHILQRSVAVKLDREALLAWS